MIKKVSSRMRWLNLLYFTYIIIASQTWTWMVNDISGNLINNTQNMHMDRFVSAIKLTEIY